MLTHFKNSKFHYISSFLLVKSPFSQGFPVIFSRFPSDHGTSTMGQAPAIKVPCGSSLLMVPSPEESIVMKSFFTFLARRNACHVWLLPQGIYVYSAVIKDTNYDNLYLALMICLVASQFRIAELVKITHISLGRLVDTNAKWCL